MTAARCAPAEAAADEQPLAAEFGSGVFDQPHGRSLAVVGTGGVGVLRREPVVDAHGYDPEFLDQREVRLVAHARAPDDPAAPVDVEVDARRFRAPRAG